MRKVINYSYRLAQIGIIVAIFMSFALGPFNLPIHAQGGVVPTGAFFGEYYNNKDLTDLTFSREDSEINFDWGLGSPDSSVDPDTFSVRWTGNFIFEGGRYEFSARSDDGIRIYIDNERIIDQWKNQTPKNVKTTTNVEGGAHQIKVEYYEDHGGARVRVSWDRTGPVQSQEVVNGTIVTTPTLTPSPTVTPTEAQPEVPQVLDAEDSGQLPKTGLSDFFDIFFIGLLGLVSLLGLYLSTRFKTVS